MPIGEEDLPSGAVTPDAAPELGYQRFDCTVEDPVALAAATDAARRAVEQGECIVMPTDTVYGIGVDAFDPDAVQRLLDAKRRGRDMPPPVLIAEPSLMRALATEVPEPAKELVEQHWPGPLTIIVKRQPSLRMDLGESAGTVALRVPDHELARDILRGTGPMAVSSANLSGRPAAMTCDEAIDQLADEVAVYLDGGPVGGSGARPSTIVDFTRTPSGQVLRHGALSVAVLRETCPDLEDLTVDFVDESVGSADEEQGALRAQSDGSVEPSPPPSGRFDGRTSSEEDLAVDFVDHEHGALRAPSDGSVEPSPPPSGRFDGRTSSEEDLPVDFVDDEHGALRAQSEGSVEPSRPPSGRFDGRTSSEDP